MNSGMEDSYDHEAIGSAVVSEYKCVIYEEPAISTIPTCSDAEQLDESGMEEQI